jgi:O-methyltransferase domain
MRRDPVHLKQSASGKARVLIVEHIVPGPETAQASKLFDIHLMCWGTGQERTEAEDQQLLKRAGRRPVGPIIMPIGDQSYRGRSGVKRRG